MKPEHIKKLKAWIDEGRTTRPEETPYCEGQLVWGVWSGEGDDEYHPPEATFASKTKAEGYGQLVYTYEPWVVLPCVADITYRDNTDIPQEE